MTEWKAALEAQVWPCQTFGLRLPEDLRQFLNRVVIQRARSKGHASISSLLGEMIERNHETLLVVLGKTVH
jgi:hypothetical protein